MLQSKREKSISYSIGLDPSLTSFGVHFRPIDGEGEWYGFAVTSEKGKAAADTHRIFSLYEEVVEAIENLGIEKVSIAVFEDYGPINRMAGKITQRAELCGLLKRYLLTVVKTPVITVTPTALKKFATGTAKAKKDAVMSAAAALGYIFETRDEADAYFAAMLGAHLINGDRIGVEFIRVNP